MRKALLSILILISLSLTSCQLTFKNNCSDAIVVFSSILVGSANPYSSGKNFPSGHQENTDVDGLWVGSFYANAPSEPGNDGATIAFFNFTPDYNGVYWGEVAEGFNYVVQIKPNDSSCATITCTGPAPSDECKNTDFDDGKIRACKNGTRYLITFCPAESKLAFLSRA